MHILSPVTDNCSSWISGRGRMAVEMFHDQVSTMECARGRDWTRGCLHAKRTRFRSSYRARQTQLGNKSNLPQGKYTCTTGMASSFLFVCLCWGLTSQSTIFQSYRDGATASWVINQYFRGVKCLAQGHNTAAVGFEPPTSRSGVRHSTTEPPRSPLIFLPWSSFYLDQWFYTLTY